MAALIFIVLFQPELRHALNRLEVTLRWPRRRGAHRGALEAIATATFSLAAARRGAPIDIGRRDAVAELVRGGLPLGGQISLEILEAIFRKVSPAHAGAALIERDHIVRVGAVLPLAHSEDLPRLWSTRHRAAMGLAEQCDALVIVASEKRGEVTLVHDSDRMDAVGPRVASLVPPNAWNEAQAAASGSLASHVLDKFGNTRTRSRTLLWPKGNVADVQGHRHERAVRDLGERDDTIRVRAAGRRTLRRAAAAQPSITGRSLLVQPDRG